MPIFARKSSSIYLGIVLGIIFLGGLAGAVYMRHVRKLSESPVVEPRLDIFSEQPGQQAVTKPGILDELPVGAPVIAYLNLAELRKWQQAPLTTLLGIDSSSPQEDQEYRKFVRETGFDYSRDLDRVAISLWPASLGVQAGSTPVQNRAFAIAEGRFDEEKIKAYALRVEHAHIRAGQQFYEVAGDPPVVFEFRSTTELAFASGDNASALLTASTSEASKKKDPALQSEIDRVAAAPLFAIMRGDKLPASFYSSLQTYPQIEHLARDVLTLIVAGQPAGNTLRVALDAETASRTDALEIASLLEISRMGISAGLSDPKAQPQMTGQQKALIEALVKELGITHEGRQVSIRLGITPAMLNAAYGSTSAPASVSQARH